MYYHVKEAEYLYNYTVRVTFETGEMFDLDLEPFLKGDLFRSVKDVRVFSSVFVHPEQQILTWPNDADIPAETLYAYAKGN